MKRKNQFSFGLLLFAVLAISSFALVSCEDDEKLPKYDPPASHTINNEGRMHKPGLFQPLDNCTACHGADLKGGSVGVSCFECHSQKW